MIALRWIVNIVKKDWADNASTILIFLVAMCLPLFAPGDELKKEMMAGVLVGAAYGYAHYIFTMERTRRTLPLMLGLPLRPVPLILGKYVSFYSMALLTVNVPGIFLLDARTVYLFNAELLVLGTLCMACTVLSELQFAPMIPLFLVGLAFQRNTYHDFEPYVFQTATVGLVLSPIIAIVSALLFKRRVAVR